MYKHEDERRTLVEVISDEQVRSVKVLYAKAGCVVGDHHHDKKDERFYLISGSGTATIGDKTFPMECGVLYELNRGTYHKFELTEGSVLLGTASEPFNQDDEIK